jgi:predicted Zn-dependent protease with MMP-like domain
MLTINEDLFRKIVSESIDSLPDGYIGNMKNVAIVVEDEPSPQQLAKLHVHEGSTLFGLYEGIPLTRRSGNYGMVLPDKITIFKNPLLQNCRDLKDLKKQVKRTVWHEIAHHYGLDHDDINRLLNK